MLLSPTYCKRFWCMKELDIAMSQREGRVFIPVLLGLSRSELKQQLPTYRKEWQGMVGRDGTTREDIQHWEDNLKLLAEYQAIDGASSGWKTKGSWDDVVEEMAKKVVNAICWHIAPLGW